MKNVFSDPMNGVAVDCVPSSTVKVNDMAETDYFFFVEAEVQDGSGQVVAIDFNYTEDDPENQYSEHVSGALDLE
jgi:hypothetical protein